MGRQPRAERDTGFLICQLVPKKTKRIYIALI